MGIFPVDIIAEGEFREPDGPVKWSLHVTHHVIDGDEKPVPPQVNIGLFGPGVFFHASRDSVSTYLPLPVLEEIAAALPKLREEAAKLEAEFWGRQTSPEDPVADEGEPDESEDPDPDYFEDPDDPYGLQVPFVPCKVPDDILALVRWRDAHALDWWGEELVSHNLHILERRDPERQGLPEELRAAYDAFMEKDENERYNLMKSALMLIGSY